MTQKFVPLHNHCDTSFLDGYQTAEELCDRCEELGVTACALTDHGTCAGHEMFDWQIVSRKLNFKPIFGIEAYLCEDVDNHTSDRVAKDKKGNVKYDPKTGEPVMEKQKPRDFNHACLWAQDDEGLENLWTLSTLAYTDGFYYKPRIDLAMLRKHHKGLFVSDGCMLSQVSRAIVSGNIDKAYEWEQKLIDIFGKDNVLVEIHTWQFAEPHTDEQRKLNEDMCKTNLHKIQIARKLGLRMIAVNDSHYAKREDYKWHELEWATTTGKGDAYNDDKTGGGRGETAAWVMSDDEVRYWLGRHSIPKDIIEECIDNTQWVAEHCNAKLKRGMVPPRYKETKEEDEKHFDKVLMDGIRELVPRDKVEQYLDELNKEVELIKKSDLTGYFNTVADYSNFVRDEDVDGEKYGIPGKKASVLGPGRGSAGGSLVCYLMHITNVDPIRFGLFFERFLTAGRVMETVTCEYEDGTSKTFTDVHEEVKLADGTTKEAWQQIDESWDTEYGKLKHTSFVFKDCPDIDLDFEASVIPYLNKYLKLKYGEYGFCQIGTQLLLKMSMAIKDVGKVHGMTNAALNDVVKRMAATGWRMEDWVSEHTYEEMVEWFCKTHRDEVVADLFENSDFMWQAYNWGGRFRGEGVHASGYVISKQSMLGKLPLRIKDGVLITQFEHNGVARLGFIKYDILKLSSLGVIRECYELTHNGELDVRDVYREMRDERTSENAGMWKQTWSGDTIGIFQMDTPLGTKTAMNARMKSLRDAAMLSAVDRPGMVISGRINDFYKVRLGKEPIMQYHPFVDDILAETSGFIVYQEQIMSIFGRLCHYNPAQRDYIRKIIGKKLRFEMPKQKAVLDKCCLEDEAFVKAVPSKYKDAQECVDDLWNGITGAGSYAFNKSHSVAYGMITYEQQRYKYKHPEVFMVASMNNNMGDPEYVTYAKVHGMQIAPPNVNKSSWRYELSDGAIYMPLSIIKGVGGAAVDEILRGQPFSSFDDYLARTSGRGGRKRNIVKALISVGAFDGVDERDRFQLMVDYKTSIKEEPPKRNTWKNPRVRGKIEQELIGISLSYDPVLDNRQWLESQGPQTYADMLQHEVGDGICVAGKVESIRRHIQKNGGEMAWIAVQLVSHEVVTVTMFATNWSKCKDLVFPNDIVAFNCKRTNDYNGKMSIVGFSCKNHSIELSQEEA